MKELTIEQKAQRYDEAIKVAKSNYETIVQMDNDCTFAKEGIVNTFHRMFPELKESEDERIRKALMQNLKERFGTKGNMGEGLDMPDVLAWLEKQTEQKPAETEKGTKGNNGEIPNSTWSDEDERRINHIIAFMSDEKRIKDTERMFPIEEDVRWLKSLRPQNWTKEDKERYISCLQRLGTGNPEQPETINSKWFKEHVYPQSHWKPTKEQMSAIEGAVNDWGFQRLHLNSLYEQLKKLMEE